MTSLENLYYMPTCTDSWSSQPLTTPLQNTFYDPFSPLSDMVIPESTSSTLTSSSFSGSDIDMAPTQTRSNLVCNKKTMKRKSRAVKKNTTTFINADGTNFRRLVQQMTGVGPVLKPEPQRVGDGCVPMLDTSAFLLDHHQEFTVNTQQGYFPAEGGAEFNTQSFPTLESSL